MTVLERLNLYCVILSRICPSQDLSFKSHHQVRVRVWIFKIICGLLIDANSNSEYIVLNGRVIMNNELKTCGWKRPLFNSE
jgi:hypothetical protein